MKSLPLPACILIYTLISSARAAKVLDHFDLDSLVYMSESIVRAQVGASQAVKTDDGDCIVFEVKALDCFKGPIKAGQSFRITGLDEYHRGPGLPNLPDAWSPVQQGDIVYLFLVPNGKRGFAMYRLTNADWTVIESGARLVVGENIYSFGQFFPGPAASKDPRLPRSLLPGFVTMTNITFPGAPVVTRAAFEDRLHQSLDSIAKISQLLSAGAAPDRVDECVKFLRSRSDVLKAEMATTDKVGELFVQRIIPLADPAALDQLRTGAPTGIRFELENALQRNAGRSYLLDHVANSHEPIDRRLELANILASAGHTYSLECDQQEQGKRTDVAIDFATRLASLAIVNLNTKLAEPLLRGIVACGPASNNTALASDIQSALHSLADAFPTAAPIDQFRIAETLLQMNLMAYRQLLPKAGFFLTLIEPDRDFAAALAQRELHVACRFRGATILASKLRLVLRPVDGGNEIEIPVDSSNFAHLPANTFGGTLFKASIPSDTPAGKYHLLLRSQGDGIGFDIDLPK